MTRPTLPSTPVVTLMSASRKLLLVLALPALFLVGYVVYLAAGGMWGREYIKARLARATTDATYTVSAGPSGGDCDRIGSWENASRSCVLDGDVERGANIFIESDGVVLDGAGHRMRGNGQKRALILVGNSDVRVRDLAIHGFREGIYLQFVKRSVLEDLVITETTSHGIHLTGESPHNAIVDNQIGPVDEHGVGGNHSSQFDEASEGCRDADGDGFCDEPNDFERGIDHRPFAAPIFGKQGPLGWPTEPGGRPRSANAGG